MPVCIICYLCIICLRPKFVIIVAHNYILYACIKHFIGSITINGYAYLS